MALRFIDGFSHYATSDVQKKWSSQVTTGVAPAITAGAGRRGSSALRLVSPSGASNVTRIIDAQASWVLGFAFRVSALFGSTRQIAAFQDAGTAQCELRLSTTGILSVTRNGSALTSGASTLKLPVGEYVFIEWKVTIADSITAGSCKVRVNGADWVTVATGQDTKNTANATADRVVLGVDGSIFGSGNIDFSDIYLCDAAGSANNDFLGDRKIETLFPTADGNYTQLTCSTGSSHFALVDENPPNTSDYNSSSTVGNKDTYGMSDLSPAVGAVAGMQINVAALSDDGGAKSIAPTLRSSTTDADGTSQAITAALMIYRSIFETDPATAVAWTGTGLNAAEAGAKVTA